MDFSVHQDVRLSAAAERQMRSWARMQEMAERKPVEEVPRVPPRTVSYVTISRESGTDATAVAHLVAKMLGWHDYGRTLRDHVAQWYNEPRFWLDPVDETPHNWAYDIFGTWLDRRVVTHEKFFAQVEQMVRILARRGPAVFVGRGAQFILPRGQSLAVRLVAAEGYRVDRVQQRQNFATPGEARRWLRKVDTGRRDFIRRYFQEDTCDPHLYELVINVERVAVAGAAEQIAFAVRQAEHRECLPEAEVAGA